MAAKGGIDDVGGIADTISSPVGTVTTRPLISLTWNKTSATLGLGTVVSSPPKGGLNADGPHGDPDIYVGILAVQPQAPTLGLGTILSPTGKGDVGDVYGSPDLASQDPTVAGLIAWNVTSATLSVASGGSGGGTLVTMTPKGVIPDPNTWNNGGSALGLGTISSVTGKGDIEGDYRNGTAGAEGNWFIATWNGTTPTIGLGTLTSVTGKGDITDPYAWEDAVFFFTSQTYPVVSIDNFTEGLTLTGGFFEPDLVSYTEDFTLGLTLTGGNIHLALIIYSNWPPENFSLQQPMLTSGSLVITTGYVVYSNWPPENFTEGLSLTGGSLVVAAGYINYTNWTPENFTLGLTLTGGSLT
jgi:hypothetical protein